MNLLNRCIHSIRTYRHVFATYKYFFAILLIVLSFFALYIVAQDVQKRYDVLLSTTIYDRNGTPLSIQENHKGHYVSAIHTIPDDFARLLIQKEDTYFYYHFGVNPLSTMRAMYRYVTENKAGGASTITQQLSKNLLGTELDRNVGNKVLEMLYSISIELFYSKAEILVMYANTVYLGNQVQGFQTGSYAYFNKPLVETTHSERVSLLATLSYPNARNPWEEKNKDFAENLNRRISPSEIFIEPQVTDSYSFQSETFFELHSAGVTCTETCYTSVDNTLTKEIREILKRHLSAEWTRGARNGAVVVIDPQTSEVLALVGSKNPKNASGGDQINMALQPRPIGSTVKPFIYLKGFMEGLRPYTLVDDREYKYSIATGFPLYPKNYDGQYRGEVTLHESLSNSLNVPSVKVLEFVGLQNFYAFLSEKLKFKPIQPYDSYQYGIALGGLEMDLLTLTHYFTIFPRMGTIEPIHILKDSTENYSLPPQSEILTKHTVSDKKFTQLVHAILSDRLSGVNQFGLESTLNIETSDYGVKTGTSRDFHDSWVVGYTGDFVVGVWIGNTENEPLKQVSGQSGAGAVWHDVMNALLETPYNSKTALARDSITQFPIKNSNEWGLIEDNIDEHRILLSSDALIQSPYSNDSFEFFKGMTIPLRGSKELEWSVNGKIIGMGNNIVFHPDSASTYEIMASDKESNRREIIQLSVVTPE
jgi:membrane carboxypeptidase/penicillin-binding protein PbpC